MGVGSVLETAQAGAPPSPQTPILREVVLLNPATLMAMEI